MADERALSGDDHVVAGSGPYSAWSASSISASSRARCEDRVLEAAAGAEERDAVLARGPDRARSPSRGPRTGCRGRPRCRRSRSRSSASVESGSSTGRARGRRGGAARRSAAGCARGRGRWASGRRPARAWRWVMAEIVSRRRVHVQRSFCGGYDQRLLMDPRFLRTFVRVVRLGSFSRRRARARLHAVRGVPAHRGAGGRRRRGAA